MDLSLLRPVVANRPNGNAAVPVWRIMSCVRSWVESDGDGASTADLSAAVCAAQRGDEGAFRTLYRAVQPGLLRYLRIQVGEAADDVASETWLQIARDIRTFSGDSAGFRGWAATIARHRAMDYLRHERRLPPSNALEARKPGRPSKRLDESKRAAPR